MLSRLKLDIGYIDFAGNAHCVSEIRCLYFTWPDPRMAETAMKRFLPDDINAWTVFVAFVNIYFPWVILPIALIMMATVTAVWMGTTHSVSPELLQPLMPVSRSFQDPRVESQIPLNTEAIGSFPIVEVPGWEFGLGDHEQRLIHTLGIISLHNGGTYQIDPLTAPSTFVAEIEVASESGVDSIEQFLLYAGAGASWRNNHYEAYETVQIELIPAMREEVLLKLFFAGALLGPMMLAGSFAVLRVWKARSKPRVE